MASEVSKSPKRVAAMKRVARLRKDELRLHSAMAEYRARALAFGSNENHARWVALGSTIIWCVIVLGVERARGVVERAYAPSDGHSRIMMAHLLRSSESATRDGRRARVALSLLAKALPRETLLGAIDEFYRGVGHGPPWLEDDSEAIARAASIDRLLNALDR